MTKTLNGHNFSAAPSAVASIVVGMTLMLIGVDAAAQQRMSSRPSTEVVAPVSAPADLEKAFWICDHAATNHGVDGGAAIACGAITESLKVSKFNGDFDLMLVWWRKNKAAEHQALTTAGHAVVSR
jgi:hypothetical protein